MEAYAKQNGFTNLRWYTDDGYSGANFQRPGFQAMLADIEAGKVGTVIVKDMSRLGRNYLQVGFYTEMLFPQKGVRFIAVNDNVDSANGGMDNDFTPLRNLFNEWLVRDTSKKIKAVKKAKGMSGKPVTSKPVYGYLMDKDENYIVDEEAAPVVRQIYQLCLAGNGPTKIARMLTEQQIPTPGTLEYRRTGSTRRYHPGYECKWATNTVVHLLENREYTGCLVNFKTEKPSYKVKHSVENPIEKQAIFPNHHEPIIDTETWERVQELRNRLLGSLRNTIILFCSFDNSFNFSLLFPIEMGGHFYFSCRVFLLEKQCVLPPFRVGTDEAVRHSSCQSDMVGFWGEQTSPE